MFPQKKPSITYKPKPYEQMIYPGQRVQIDVKVVPRRCIADSEFRLFQYAAIDEFTRLRFLAAYPEQSTYSSADFLKRAVVWYARKGIQVECVQTDNGFEFTNRFSNSQRNLPTLFEAMAQNLVSVTNSFVHILPDITARWNVAVARIRSAFIHATLSTLSMILKHNLLCTIVVPTTFP